MERRELLKQGGRGLLSLAILPSNLLSIDQLLVQPSGGSSDSELFPFGETRRLEIPKYPWGVEPVKGYGPHQLSGFSFRANPRYYNDLIVDGNKVVISEDVREGVQVPQREHFVGGRRLVVGDLSTGKVLNLTEPIRTMQQSARIPQLNIDPLDFDINGDNVTLTVVSRGPRLWGALNVDTNTRSLTRISNPSVNTTNVRLEDRIVILGDNNHKQVGAIDLRNLNHGVFNLSQGLVGNENIVEYTAPGIAIFNNSIGQMISRFGYERFELGFNQLYLVDLTGLGQQRIEELRRPLTSRSRTDYHVYAIIGDKVFYSQNMFDPNPRNIRYFSVDLRSGRRESLSPHEREELLMEQGAIITTERNPDSSTTVYFRKKGMKSAEPISDPARSADAYNVLPDKRIAILERFKDQNGRPQAQFYILNL